MLPWIFGILMLFGGGFLLLSVVVGEIAEGTGGILENFDTVLEGIGIDLIPDELDIGESKSIGCSAIAAFLTGFGAVGLASSLLGANVIVSIFVALLSGLVGGGIYVLLMGFVIRQQASTEIKDSDFIGLTGRATIDSPKGEIGQVAINVGGEMKTYPANIEGGEALKYNDRIEVLKYEGGSLYVRKIE